MSINTLNITDCNNTPLKSQNNNSNDLPCNNYNSNNEKELNSLQEDVYQALSHKYQLIKSRQGVIGKLWNWSKNLLNLRNSSNNIEKNLESFKNNEVSLEDSQNAVERFNMGQKRAVDFVADVAASVLSLKLVKFAAKKNLYPFLLASIAPMVGAFSKTALKFLDAKTGDRKYSTFFYDILTGGINGFASPIANAWGKTTKINVAKTLGAKIEQNISTSPRYMTYKNLSDLFKMYNSDISNFYKLSFSKIKIKNCSLPKKFIAITSGATVCKLSKYSLASTMREISLNKRKRNNCKSDLHYHLISKMAGGKNIEENGKASDNFEKYYSNDIYNINQPAE